MIRETATAAEVYQTFVTPDAEQALKEITAIIDGQLDMEKSWEVMEACIEASKGKIDDNTKPWERIMWLVRQAYIFGFNYASSLHYEAAEAGYKALFYGEPATQT